MAIQNIQGLVDKKGLSYIQEGNFITQYYNEALANLGQRNTNDNIFNFYTIKIKDLFSNYIINNYVIYYNNTFYTLEKNDDEIDEYDEINIIQEIIVNDNLNNLCEITINDDSEDENIKNNFNKILSIITKLYDTITEGKKDTNYKPKLFIPSNYEFGIITNGINKNIYYCNFKDLYVNLITKDIQSDNDNYELENFNYNQTIFYNGDENDNYIKTDVYDYFFDNDIANLHLKFTLPYVNDEDYWVINNVKTSIQAKAHDAMNLNIILALYQKDEYKFLSGFNSYIDTNKISLNGDKTRFNIKFSNEIIDCQISLPDLNSTTDNKNNSGEINKILSNSTLIIISKVLDVAINNNDPKIEKYQDGYVTTIWKYDDINKNFKCICIDDESNIALDFNQLTNFENLLKYEINNQNILEPDNYLFTHVIFDQIHQNLKQENNNISTTYIYPVLQNIKGTDYNNKYANNLNFSLKYINNIFVNDNNEIKSVAKKIGNKYFIINSENNLVTNSLYNYVNNNKINYYNEFIPNYNVPTFDMSEFLVKDINTMNKYNILSFSYSGQIYYSYIGTSYEYNKNTLVIGSSYQNINLGNYTLINKEDKNKFLIQNTLSIDFNNTYLNGKVNIQDDLAVNGNIIISKLQWYLYSNENNYEIYNTSFYPKANYYLDSIYMLNINNLTMDINKMNNDIENDNKLEKNGNITFINPILYIKTENNTYNYYKYNDLIYLPHLLNYIQANSTINIPNDVNFASETNDIISIDGEPKYFVSSNNLLESNIKITNSSSTGINVSISNMNTEHIGNLLTLIYYSKNNSLLINENNSNKVKSIWKIPSNIYTS